MRNYWREPNPIITGDATASYTVGQTIDFNDPSTFNLNATDFQGTDITGDITVKSNVDGLVGTGTDIAGTYVLVYTVTDSYGKVSNDFTVTVTIA